MRRRELADWVLVGSFFAGLVYPPTFLGMFAAPFVSGRLFRIRLNWGYLLLILSTLWAIGIVLYRGVGDSGQLIARYCFLWTIPFFLLAYQPNERTLRKVFFLLLGLFLLDCVANVYALLSGTDFLGRVIDERAGVVADHRYGGLFGHSFYSGGISMLVTILVLSKRRYIWFAVFPILNIILSASWRFLIIIPLALYFFLSYKVRSRVFELAQIAIISILAIGLVVATSSFGDYDFGNLPANDLRIFAWQNAISEIVSSPFIGVGYPKEYDIDSMNVDTIVNNYIAESWYLSAALTFGIPYALCRLAGLLLIFYGSRFHHRSQFEGLLVPLVMIDLVFGGFVEGALIYTLLWMVIASSGTDESKMPFGDSQLRFRGH